ncbi:hypothetical protein Afil01_33050 [Actinorhabdospora filicis]|uniref:Uncharacterized protein n=1 Tax=Actinorhabdospora filicis TaxID=1785913 RepID=A0A9W6SLL5_9ACTN|nr:hypothetical protein [Actinorhabdospora filicis]GLZ78498.1 hypothetical protein Afil01_33050 [Actinorhabdospora filicis]
MERARRRAAALDPRPRAGGSSSATGGLEQLQRMAGNRAVARLLSVQRADGEVGWFEQRRIWVHEAVAAQNWVGSDPPGVYWVLNGLALDDIAKVFGMLTGTERGLVASHLNRADGLFDRARISMGIRRGGDAAQRQEADEVHWAIRVGRYPAAFERLGKMSAARADAVLATLDRTHLELLTAHRTETGRATNVERTQRAVAAALGVRYVPVEERIDVDLELDAEGLQGRFTNPRESPRYIDNAMVAVGVSPMYADGMLVYIAGMELPVLIPGDIVRSGGAPSTAASQQVYSSRAEAQAKAGEGRHAYFEGAGGAVIVPTVLSAATAPKVMATYLVAFNQWLHDVQETLTLIAIGLAAELVAGVAVSGIARGVGKVLDRPVPKGRSASGGDVIDPPHARPNVPATARARATPEFLRKVAENPHDYLVYRTPDPDVVANQPLTHTGENTPKSEFAKKGVHFARGDDVRGYGEYCVTVHEDQVDVAQNRADPTEYISAEDIPVGTGQWHTWQEYQAARAAAKPK